MCQKQYHFQIINLPVIHIRNLWKDFFLIKTKLYLKINFAEAVINKWKPDDIVFHQIQIYVI